MLDGSPTYYITYSGDSEGTTELGKTQDTITFSGSNGAYQATQISSYYDANGNLVSTSEPVPFNITLNSNGTFTATPVADPSYKITATLIMDTAGYLDIDFADTDKDSWDDRWYLAPPSGWVSSSDDGTTGTDDGTTGTDDGTTGTDDGTTGTDDGTTAPLAFILNDFNFTTRYEVWENDNGSGWDSMTLQFFNSGVVWGTEGIVTPTPQVTGTWSIDAAGRLVVIGSMANYSYYTLTSREINHFKVCWGETAAEADSCTMPEYLFTDLDAASAFVATPPQ